MHRAGLLHVRVSERLNGHNQILVASRYPIQLGDLSGPLTPDGGGQSNFLHVTLTESSLEVVGLRVPAYVRTVELKSYWDRLVEIVSFVRERRIVIMGDLNADPDSRRRVGDRYLRLLEQRRWSIPRPAGPWSHTSGTRVDHAIVSPTTGAARARYVSHLEDVVLAEKGNRTAASDHAALVVEVESTRAV